MNMFSSVGAEIRVVKLVVVVVPLLSSQRAAGTAALGFPTQVVEECLPDILPGKLGIVGQPLFRCMFSRVQFSLAICRKQ